HAIVDDEVLDEGPERRPRPGDEARTAEESTSRLALHDPLAIVERPEKLDPLLELFARAYELEGRARQLARQSFDPREHDLRDRKERTERGSGQIAPNGRDVLVEIDRAAEGNDRSDSLSAKVGRRLVGEHAALGVAAQVDALA